MKLRFSKYQGAGNDFILIDNRDGAFRWTDEVIRFLADRHFGIGSDGVMLLEKDPECDFYMRFFNPDATQEGMCGNGSRCIALFARHCGIQGDALTFRTIDGVHHIRFTAYHGDWAVLKVRLIDVAHIEQNDLSAFLNTGVNHYVEFVSDVDEIAIMERGAAVRYAPQYAPIGGTNANFVQLLNPTTIALRTYERGVEAETLACGTGATAAAIATAVRAGNLAGEVLVKARGGDLNVYFRIDGDRVTDIFLEGEARRVFNGEIEI